eukprot:4025408-Amphidinium_carterae.1
MDPPAAYAFAASGLKRYMTRSVTNPAITLASRAALAGSSSSSSGSPTTTRKARAVGSADTRRASQRLANRKRVYEDW